MAVRSGQVDEDSFSIMSDAGDMIAGAMVFDHKRVEVKAVAAYRHLDPPPGAPMPAMQEFAKSEARRLGIINVRLRHPPSPSRTHATAAVIGIAAEARARLVMLESMRWVAGRLDPIASSSALQRVFVITDEERRMAEISDARWTT